MKYYITLFLFTLLFTNSFSQDRALWATIWSCNKPDKIDDIIENANKYGYNKIFIQTRYRADAMYFPNKNDSSYKNTESRCYILNDSDFDPLQYAIDKAKGSKIEIHAWVPIFVVTPHNLNKIDSAHIYYSHSNWITYSEDGKPMHNTDHEGAFLDPGIPQVQEYTLNILKDIALNYNIAGIQLDYIRYPDTIFGHNPLAIDHFKRSGESNFTKWKESQISSFVNKTYIMLKNINPNLQISAAVFGNQRKAINLFSQNWKKWLEGSYIDKIYVMAYNTSDVSFTNVLNQINDVDKRRTTIILRAWVDRGHYSTHKISSKIKISKRKGFHNFGFYSYSGLIKNKYIGTIKY